MSFMYLYIEIPFAIDAFLDDTLEDRHDHYSCHDEQKPCDDCRDPCGGGVRPVVILFGNILLSSLRMAFVQQYRYNIVS